MAPPSTRRPGFSRRAQFGLFIGYVIAVGGILFALIVSCVYGYSIGDDAVRNWRNRVGEHSS